MKYLLEFKTEDDYEIKEIEFDTIQEVCEFVIKNRTDMWEYWLLYDPKGNWIADNWTGLNSSWLIDL
ncbi:hypothetical protein PL11201_290010 [Planktothrix sp. PCC 11201]|uniref:hypothetical protein n=1 Tax=Planktothrix sp. PCC 11201 TaxID=1729650 RepID=UPI000913D1D2|nr:hypothetical protein [Planktothrix sp. PCC 11201]SKB12042.1 hypothetical protein PL11201_290010 [Planktothrix sp. PCC 11201]